MEIIQEEVTKELKDKLNTHFDRHYESTHGISGFGEEVCFCVLSEKKEKVAAFSALFARTFLCDF